MLPAHGRAVLRLLVAVGVSGLAAEVVFITFSVANPARDSTTVDRMLGEAAFAAFAYGAIFVLVVLSRKFPAWAFPPLNSHRTPGKKRIEPRIVIPLALGLLATLALMQVVLLAIGALTARDVMVSLWHLYPICGVLAAVGLAAGGPSVAPVAPGTG